MTRPAEPEGGVRHVLVMGGLSLGAAAELAKRVRAGEDEAAVRVELLEREGKAVSWPAAAPRDPIETGP